MMATTNSAPVDERITIIPPRDGTVHPRLTLTALVMVVASFQLNATMLSPAIGDMAERLGTSTGVIGWSTTAFLAVAAALGILLPPYADTIGRRRATYLSLVVMIIGTVIALLATTAPILIVGRALQGFCGATFALANLTLRSMLNPRKYGVYLGVVAAVNSGVAGIDTLLGGVIADAFGYRGIFLVILALELVALAAVALFVPETRVKDAQKMDWPGALTMTGALWAFNMTLTLGFSTTGWSSPWTLGSLAVGIVLSVVFVAVEKRASTPLLPLSLLAQRQTWGLLATTFCTLASAFAVLIFTLPALSQDAQVGFGMSGTMSALMFLTPFSLAGWALAPIAGLIAPRIGYRLVLRAGLLGSLVLITLMIFTQGESWLLFALAFLMGASYSAASSLPLNALGVLYSSKDRPGLLPGLNSAAFNMGAAVGIGLMASLVVTAAADGAGASRYENAFIVGAVFAALALAFSFTLPGRQSADEKI